MAKTDLIRLNKSQYRATFRWLKKLAKQGPAAIASGLNESATTWLREIIRRAPVDSGLYRLSISILRATAMLPQSAVGTNTPYAASLEFDPRGHIAGGQVKAWRPGTPPITDWPAKRGHGGGGAAVGRETIMPPFRGSWQLIEGKIRAMLRARVKRIWKPPGR